MSRRFVNAVLVLFLFTWGQVALGTWRNVVPTIQMIDTSTEIASFNETKMYLDSGTITIVYAGDSLLWAVTELRALLHDSVQTTQPETLHVNKWADHLQNDSNPTIYLGLWDDASSSLFMNSSRSSLHRKPPEEGYYIWVRQHQAYLTAMTLRGLNYAVTSFWKACDQGNNRRWIDMATIVDYPTFPRRYLGDMVAFHDSNPPWGSPDLHAVALLKLGRELLLYNKGNGLVHYGLADRFNSFNATNIHNAVSRLQSGASFPDGQTSRWGAFDFDWVENFTNWNGDGNYLTVCKAIEVEKTCRFSPLNGDSSRLWMVPDTLVHDTVHVPNGDFRNADDHLHILDWEFTNEHHPWHQGGAGDTLYGYARLSDSNDCVDIVQSFHVQNTRGIPARLLMLEFSVRPWLDTVSVRFREGIDVAADSLQQCATNDPQHIKGYYDGESGCVRIVPGGAWIRLRIHFYTMGFPYDSIRLIICNHGTPNNGIDIDSIQIHEAGFCYHYPVSDDNMIPTIPMASVYHNGSLDTTLPLNSENFVPREGIFSENGYRISPRSDAYLDWSNHQLADLLDTSWVVKVKYYGVGTPSLPRFIEEPSHVGPVDGFDLRQRADNPTLHQEIIRDHMHWFDSLFTANSQSPGMKLTGYFNRGNELKYSGYTRMDTFLLHEHPDWKSYAGIWANFNSVIYSYLNGQGRPDRPVFVYADMFNPYHNGICTTYQCNPFPPVNGNSGDPARHTVPGADPNAHLVFIDWHSSSGLHSYADVDCTLIRTWDSVLAGTPNSHWEVLLALGVQTNQTWFSDAVRKRLGHMVDMANLRREHGRAFAGTEIFYDDMSTVDTNWTGLRNYVDLLRWGWKHDATILPLTSFRTSYDRSHSQAEATIQAYPVPYPEELVSHVESVVLQYRFGLKGNWMTQSVTYKGDSLYNFKVDLPDSGGVMEYRFWAFDDFGKDDGGLGRYGSYPPRDTKWTDPDAGERLYLAFERRKTTPITTAETFYAPGVISQKYDIQAGGSVTIQPLPGYRYATMYVTNDAGFVLNKAVSGFDPPKLMVAGTDSSIVRFASGNEDTLWKGLQVDITDSANVTLNYAQFSGAKMGLMINGMSGAAAKAKIELDSCIMEKCSIGMALSTNVSAKVMRSIFRDCYDTGLMLVAQSRVSLDSCLVENNTNYGASISEGSEAQFEHTTIQGNGSKPSIHAGVYVLNGGKAEFTCCDIKQNHAPGIRGTKAAVIMAGKVEELSWGGNAIMQNAAPSPDRASEISITKCTMALDGGKNKFDGGANKPWIENLSGSGGIKGMRNNYWSNLDSEKVKYFIPKEVEYKPVLTSWQACSGIQADTASCAALYLSAVNKLDKKLYAAARSDFKQLIAQYPTCEYVKLAIEGILKADQMEGIVGTSATYFHGVAQAAQTVSIARGAYAAEAWSHAYSGRTDSAHTILQYLLATAEGYMEIAASHLDLLSLELIALNMDTTQAPNADFLQAIKDSMDYWHKWLITDLNFTLEQGDVARYCGDSTTIAAAIYPHNEFISTDDDSITEVGFKVKAMHDSSTWTTWHVDSLSADSLYHWQVPVGRLGGLINYIFWAKDAHGRFATSPFGADTTYPDSGATHFLSVEIAADTIRYPDSVVVWAPATITHNIAVMDGGILVFKPYPGAADHTVRLGDSVWIEAMNYSDTVDENDPADYSKIFFLGTEQEPITVAPLMNSAGGDSTAWSDIGAYMYSNLMAKHTIFRTGLYSLNIGDPSYVNDPNHPGIAIDSCLFDTSSTTMLISGDDWEDTVSYIRHTEFVQLGAQINEEPFGGLMISDAQIQMSDCRIHDNAREGLVLSWCWYSTFERVKVDHNHGPGLVFILGGSYPRFSCCEFSFNGDTLPEVQGVYGGPMPFSDQSNCVFMDSVGPLMKVWNDNTFNIHDGGNAFCLLGGTNKYIVRPYAGSARDISGNYWYPVGPDSSAFLSFLTPDSTQFWVDSTHLDSFAMCESMQTSLPTVIAPRMGTGDIAAPTSSVNSTPTVATIGRQTIEHAQARQDLKQAKDWEKAGNHIAAASKFRSLLSKPTNAEVTAEALSGYFMAARRSGVKTGLSSYYASLRQQLPTDALQRQAQWFELKSLELEGQPQQALHGYEEIISRPETKGDSVAAILSAMRLHCIQALKKKPELSSIYSQHRVTNVAELARRSFKLVRSLYGDDKLAGSVVHAAPIPKAYKLYQNYPNPFNPVTEIQFDLPEKTRVELRIFNILGQRVTTLVDEVRTAGAYHILWDGKSAGGVPVSSGMYIYQLKCDKFVDAKKMILLR